MNQFLCLYSSVINRTDVIQLFSAPELEHLYPPYVNNYDHAIEVIEDCEMRPEFLRFIKVTNIIPLTTPELFNKIALIAI